MIRLPQKCVPIQEVSESDFVWWPALFGLGCLYVPLYWSAAGGLWQSDDHAHGAIVLVVVLWIFWTLKIEIASAVASPYPLLGWPLFIAGLCLYIFGRMVGITTFEFGSQSLVLTGLLMVLRGPRTIRMVWFPLFYLIFMIPLPSVFVDSLTEPLKGWISGLVVDILHVAGYPIARNGVTIVIGQYQMLVADACSGLHSMFSLSALGTLFIYMTGRKGFAHNSLLLASIIPVAFIANLMRVILLVLLTYHFGDDVGQGFLHGAAGVVLMLVALISIFIWDSILSSFFIANPATRSE